MAGTYTSVQIEKIPGGFKVDGLALMKGKCGCTSLARCCYSWSKVKKQGSSAVEMTVKMTDPDTNDNFDWGYKVEKDGVTVTVSVQDARDKVISAAFIPPPVSAWEEKGWTVLEKTGDREDGVVWRCAMCKWLYKENDEETTFEELPDSWKCPTCGVGKEQFEQIG